MADYMIPFRELQECKIRLERKMESLFNLSVELVCNDGGAMFRRDQERMEILFDKHLQICAQINECKRSRDIDIVEVRRDG